MAAADYRFEVYQERGGGLSPDGIGAYRSLADAYDEARKCLKGCFGGYGDRRRAITIRDKVTKTERLVRLLPETTSATKHGLELIETRKNTERPFGDDEELR